MKKIIVIGFLVMILSLVACGGANSEESTATSEANIETVETIEEAFNITKVNDFYKKWGTMEEHLDAVIKPFAQNPEITSEFMTSIEKVEEEYWDLMEYVGSLTVNEYTYWTVDRASIQNQVEGHWVRQPMVTISYQEFFSEGGMQYHNGVLSLRKGYYATVEWCQNVGNKPEKDDFENQRDYEIADASKDAYFLISGETGYNLVVISAER